MICVSICYLHECIYINVALCIFVLTLLAEGALVVEIAALADRTAVGADANSAMLAGVVVLASVARVAPHALQQREPPPLLKLPAHAIQQRARFNLAPTHSRITIFHQLL